MKQNDLYSLFQKTPSFIDVRAPIEFNKGAIPGAVNLPILSDRERELVGTCYVKKGSEEAIKLGHQLVQGEVKKERINQWTSFLKTNPESYIYCARGGLRSQIAQQWLEEAGVFVPRIQEGYKGLRRYLLTQLERLCPHLPLHVVSGKTGSGKTTYIKKHPYYIDLESLANHRGSAFGGYLTPQPRLANFENELALQIIRLSEKKPSKIFVEDESQLIGKILIPDPLFDQMMKSPVTILDVALSERVQNILNEYIIEALYQAGIDVPQSHQRIQERFLANLERIRKKLGGALFTEIAKDMRVAFVITAKDYSFDMHKVWIEKLLIHYYDPRYEYSLSKRLS